MPFNSVAVLSEEMGEGRLNGPRLLDEAALHGRVDVEGLEPLPVSRTTLQLISPLTPKKISTIT